jgi:hypothetical protein
VVCHAISEIRVVLYSLSAFAGVEVFAAQQKKAKVVAAPKPIYDAPMRVVVVRNSSPACEPDCPQWISAEGEITAATPEAFRRVFKQIGSKNLPLVIRSPGGSINHAIVIGNMVRKRKMTVAVGYAVYRGCRPDEAKCKLPKEAKGIYTGSITDYDAFCNSACPMILAAGTTRLASSVAYVGLHQPKTEWSREWVRWRETYRTVNGKKKILKRTIVSRKIVKGKTTYGLDKSLRKKMGTYYKSMGVDVAILEDIQRAKYQDMYWLPAVDRDRLLLRTSLGFASALDDIIAAKPDVSGTDYCEINGAKYVGEICKAKKASVVATVVAKPVVPEMTVRLAQLAEAACAPKCPSWIVLDGKISSSTPGLLEVFAKKLGRKHATVVFYSPGGDVDAAIALGRTIRSLGFDTAIGKTVSVQGLDDKRDTFEASTPGSGFCRGSCLMAYIGGKQRHIVGSDMFQIQAPFADIDAQTVRVAEMKMERHVNDMGADSDFIVTYAHRPELSRDGVSAAQLLKYRIATDTKDTAVLFDWKRAEVAGQE